MPNPLTFLHHKSASTPAPGVEKGKATAGRTATAFSQHLKDHNVNTNKNLLLAQKCVYERQLPGDSYITAHITRLQSGYYDSPIVHGDRVENVRFIAIRFVFHPADSRHRFVSARIRLAAYNRGERPHRGVPLPPQFKHPNNGTPQDAQKQLHRKPRFLRHAPRLLYGSLSPETLDWTFNLAGSLGVSQGPATASVNPEYGYKSSYKVYKMMKIQGSIRSLYSWYGQQYDVEDGELVWTLEENALQKSGLPRYFEFALLLTKGDLDDVAFQIDIEPVVGSWYGTYPRWWLNRIWYQPMYKEPIDLDRELGQKFGPSTIADGFNFASLMDTFDDFVNLPGTTYTKAEPVPPDAANAEQPDNKRQLTASPAPKDPQHYNINLFLRGHTDSNSSSPSATPARISVSSHVPRPQSASPLPETGFSISKSRNHRRRNSETPHASSSSLSRNAINSKPRPVSAIYEGSPPVAPITEDSYHEKSYKDRQPSTHTDVSEDLFADPYVTDNAKAPLQPSRSLRHTRPRSGLQDEYDARKSTQASGQRPTEHSSQPRQRRAQDDNPTSTKRDVPVNRRHSLQSPPPSAVPDLSTTPTSPPPTTSPRKKRPMSMQPRYSYDSPGASPPLASPEPPRFAPPPSSHGYSYITDPVTMAEEPPYHINAYKVPSFPPTSYPAYAPTRAVGSDDDGEAHEELYRPPEVPLPPPEVLQASALPASKSISPSRVEVDSIVQKEVAAFLRAHPEIYNQDFSKTSSPVQFDRSGNYGLVESKMADRLSGAGMGASRRERRLVPGSGNAGEV